MTGLHRALTAAAPSPSPSIGYTPGDLTSASSWWEWFVGLPLTIILIVVINGLVLVGLRRVIRGVTNHIADGTPMMDRGILRPLGSSAVGSALRKADPLATARRAQRARTIGSVLRSTATIVIGTITVCLVLDALGVNIAPLIASVGVVGVALGFGAQALVKDFLTGMFMLLEDQYGVGDVIDAGPATGTVEAVTLRVTKIRDAEGVLWYVPNGSMLRVGNKTQGWATAVVEVDVDYFADLDQVRALLREAAEHVAADPALGGHLQGDASIQGIERLAADAVTLKLRVRTSPAMQWEVARALRVETRRVLEQAGVPLAGQRDLMAAHRAERAAQDGAPDAPADADRPREPATAGTRPRDPHDTPVDDVVEQRDAREAAGEED